MQSRQMGSLMAWAAGLTALACGAVPTDTQLVPNVDVALAKGGGGTTVSVIVTDQSVGVAADGDPFAITIPSGGVLDIRPACSSDDRLHLVGMDGDLGALGVRSTCNGNAGKGFVFLKPLVNTTTPNGSCPGETAPQQTANGWDFGVTNRYFFQVDSDGDGKFDDAQYTIVLTNCTINARRVTATTGDLYQGQSGTPIASGIQINVDLTF
jgi:hypothetical protein